jgi:hypothetical protein
MEEKKMAARNAMEIFTVLDKSNCRECGEKTCLAFAGAVFTGRKSITMCPTLSAADKERLAMQTDPAEAENGNNDGQLELMKEQLKKLDFVEAAERCGGRLKSNLLVVKVLGKDFSVDAEGNFSSDIHINPWIVAPFLAYVVHGKGRKPEGKWISFRELKGGRERYGLFRKRCEEDMRTVADAYPDLFADMVEIFQGKETDRMFSSDVSVVLLPLPKIPIMICYWQAGEGIDSSLNMFFDITADENIGIDGIYSICAGLRLMFFKLAQRHGIAVEQ